MTSQECKTGISGRGREREREEKIPQYRTNRESRLSILEVEKIARLVDAPSLERVAGENMRQPEIKAGSARKITGSSAVLSCSEGEEVAEFFPFRPSHSFSFSIFLLPIGMRVVTSHFHERTHTRSCERYVE